jgi:uncharacterized protein YndB with AHSA1/START domain
MKKKLMMISLIVVAVAAVFAIVVALRPADFNVTRSTTIAAAPETVFAQVNELHKWETWSPWAKMDPNAKTTYEGPAAGVGAAFAWAGNKNIGEGRMVITESRPNELVRFRLEFLKPFKGTNAAEFTFKPQGNNTLVTWTMSGKNNFITKAVGLFMDCDKMVGSQFEQGLASMKSIVESTAKK